MEKKLNKLKEEDGQHGVRMGTSQQFKSVEFKQTAGYNQENDFVSGGLLTGTRKASTDNNEEGKKKKKKKVNKE